MSQWFNEATAGLQLLSFCEVWQPFRSKDWSETVLAQEMGWSPAYLRRVLQEELETDFVTFCAVLRLAFVQKMAQNTYVNRHRISQMAGFDSLREEEISRKMLVFSKGFF